MTASISLGLLLTFIKSQKMAAIHT
jgi:hypothetical protein